MNNLIKVFVVLIFTAQASMLFAHDGHGHMPVSLKKATELALEAASSYTKAPSGFAFDKLPAAWSELPSSAASIYRNAQGYYLVAVKGPADDKTLYIKILLDSSVALASFDLRDFDVENSN